MKFPTNCFVGNFCLSIPLHENLSYEVVPVRIVDRKENKLRWRRIPIVKVMWSNHQSLPEALWKLKDDMQAKHPWLF
jgi:hypothetical protein